jgi:hypothetical protein
MKLAASKWKIAALTLITLPASIWFSTENPDLPISRFMSALGFVPLYIGAAMELHSQWVAVLEKWRNPERHVKAAPVSNKGFYILCLSLVGLVLLIICVGSMLHT